MAFAAAMCGFKGFLPVKRDVVEKWSKRAVLWSVFCRRWPMVGSIFGQKVEAFAVNVAVLRYNYFNKLGYLHKIDDICIVATVLVELLSLLCIGVIEELFWPIQ